MLQASELSTNAVPKCGYMHTLLLEMWCYFVAGNVLISSITKSWISGETAKCITFGAWKARRIFAG
jgi:hypothetical protein